MRAITALELIAWMGGVLTNPEPPENYQQPDTAIAAMFHAHPEAMERFVQAFGIACLTMGDTRSGIATIWATGFQMGRDFETSSKEAGMLEQMYGDSKQKQMRKGKKDA